MLVFPEWTAFEAQEPAQDAAQAPVIEVGLFTTEVSTCVQ